jgi:GNAT superfamily N-acetyltransferase
LKEVFQNVSSCDRSFSLRSILVVIRLFKQLAASPVPLTEGFEVRTFCDEADVDLWLRIREESLLGLIAPGRPWTESDFHREFISKPWWRPEHMWFAERTDPDGRQAVGAVALAIHESPQRVATIQWLMVRPEYRRRGIGRLLITTLEAAAWDAGCRTVTADTLTAWEAAMRLYQALGYEPRS